MSNLIPSEDNLARYCGKQKLDNGRVLPLAFHLKEDESYVSVNWLEYFNKSSIPEAISELRPVFAKKFQNIRASARFAVLNIQKAQRMVQEGTDGKESVFGTHEPMDDDPSHSGLRGMTQDNYRLIAELVAESVDATYPARQ